MESIESIEDLQSLVAAGEIDWKKYGEVNVSFHGDLILFNYSQLAQFQRRWNWFERHSRGLILNIKTGEVVARPFAKFFNYGEEYPSEDNPIVSITEKMDGSLGILYREDGQYKIATRGSFISDQAIWATEWLKRHSPRGLPDYATLLFEIIYPANRIVVDYGDRAELVLLAVIDRFTGEEWNSLSVEYIAGESGYSTPRTYTFNNLAEILEAAQALSANAEGWVLRYANGERYKVKGDAYRIAHKIMTGATFKRVLEAVETGQFDQMIEGVPDEFLAQVKVWKQEIDDLLTLTKAYVHATLQIAPTGSQKEFALWVQANCSREVQSYLFAEKSGKDWLPVFYRKAFENRQDADKSLVTDIDA